MDQYDYQFNGKESDNEIKGLGNQLDYGMRIYDPRLGRFLSRDPDFYKYPWISYYSYAINSPVCFIDKQGKGPGKIVNNSTSTITLTGEGTVETKENTQLQRGKIILNPGDVFEVESRKQGETVINGGKITRQDGNVELVNIQDVDFIDIQEGQTFIFDDGLILSDDVEVKQGNPEFNRNPDEFVPKSESLEANYDDAAFVLTPNKGEIKIEDPLELNSGEVIFSDDKYAGGEETGKIRVEENNLFLDFEIDEE